MLLNDVLIGTVLGAILWPIIQRVVDSTNRAILGFIIGGLIGGAIAWAQLGLYTSMVIGASIGANVAPSNVDLGMIFLNALFQTARGGAIGAVIALSLRSMSFVLTGAGIGLLFSLLASLSLRFLNQELFSIALTSTQLTLTVLISSLLFFGILSSRK